MYLTNQNNGLKCFISSSSENEPNGQEGTYSFHDISDAFPLYPANPQRANYQKQKHNTSLFC